MLKSRIATALVIAPITLLAVFFLPQQAFSLFVAVIVLMGAWEWTAMMRLVSRAQRTVYVLLVLLGIVMVQRFLPSFEHVIFGFSGIFWLFATALVIVYPRASHLCHLERLLELQKLIQEKNNLNLQNILLMQAIT